jgi:hypothetical protein
MTEKTKSLADLFDEEEREERKKEESMDDLSRINQPLNQEKPKEKVQRSRNSTRAKSLHVLNEKNLLIFVKQTNKTKKYEMKHRFYNSSASEIDKLVERLIKEKKLQRIKNSWIQIKS